MVSLMKVSVLIWKDCLKNNLSFAKFLVPAANKFYGQTLLFRKISTE